jgi:lysyl-tRNA synthetase class 2
MPLSSKIIIRQNIISACRQFFLDHHFREITIPILNSSLPSEPNIYPFTTTHTRSLGKNKKYFLATSPESSLKILISQGLGDCFAISPCFRNLENIGPYHLPEFLMLEWYEIGKNYLDIMTTTTNLLKSFGLPTPETISLKKYFTTFPDNEPDFNQFFLNDIELHLPTNPVFLTDYPAFLSPLAKSTTTADINFCLPADQAQYEPCSNRTQKTNTKPRREHKKKSLPVPLSERFELYINRIEIANGCTENLQPSIKVPWGQLPPCAGCGLGLDRLAMVLTASTNISQVSLSNF